MQFLQFISYLSGTVMRLQPKDLSVKLIRRKIKPVYRHRVTDTAQLV